MATQPKFKLGDHVRKVKGSRWQGRVIGTYSTTLTPEGYCVESGTELGSVQIYPAAALELVTSNSPGGPRMTDEQIDDAILARCRTNLALAKKRTQGEWRALPLTGTISSACGSLFVRMQNRGTLDDSAYIAACAGDAERGWRSTIASIELGRNLIQFSEVRGQEAGHKILAAVRAEWADRLLTSD